jgi:hypothetical protein
LELKLRSKFKSHGIVLLNLNEGGTDETKKQILSLGVLSRINFDRS